MTQKHRKVISSELAIMLSKQTLYGFEFYECIGSFFQQLNIA